MSRLENRLAAPGGRIDPQAALFVELVVAGEGPDIVVRMDHEEVVEQIVHVVGRQSIGRQPRDAQMRRLRAPASYFCNCTSRLGTRLIVAWNSGISRSNWAMPQ